MPKPAFNNHNGWTTEKRNALCELLRKGCSISGACAELGLSRRHFYELMDAGEHESAKSEHRAFYFAVTRALGQLENSVAATFKEHAATDWRACEAFLKRRFANEWGGTKDQTPSKDEEIELTPEQWVALHELIARRMQ